MRSWFSTSSGFWMKLLPVRSRRLVKTLCFCPSSFRDTSEAPGGWTVIQLEFKALSCSPSTIVWKPILWFEQIMSGSHWERINLDPNMSVFQNCSVLLASGSSLSRQIYFITGPSLGHLLWAFRLFSKLLCSLFGARFLLLFLSKQAVGLCVVVLNSSSCSRYVRQNKGNSPWLT